MELCNGNPCQITTGSLMGNNMLAAVVKGDTIAGTTRSIRVKRNLVISSRHRAHIKRLGSSFHVTLLRMSQASPSLTLKSIRLCLGGPLMSSRAAAIGRVRAENALHLLIPSLTTPDQQCSPPHSRIYRLKTPVLFENPVPLRSFARLSLSLSLSL